MFVQRKNSLFSMRKILLLRWFGLWFIPQSQQRLIQILCIRNDGLATTSNPTTKRTKKKKLLQGKPMKRGKNILTRKKNKISWHGTVWDEWAGWDRFHPSTRNIWFPSSNLLRDVQGSTIRLTQFIFIQIRIRSFRTDFLSIVRNTSGKFPFSYNHRQLMGCLSVLLPRFLSSTHRRWINFYFLIYLAWFFSSHSTDLGIQCLDIIIKLYIVCVWCNIERVT